jgi:hypothetical protein
VTGEPEDPTAWGEDFEWTQLPARESRRGEPEPPAAAVPPPIEQPTDPRSDGDGAPEALRRTPREPHRVTSARPASRRIERRWLAMAAIFAVGLGVGGLIGYLGRGDGRPSNATTIDVSIDPVTVTVAR